MTAGDGWEPSQYERFAAERRQPFLDLLGLLHPVPGGRVIDLGCGTGELTLILHTESQAGQTVGVDRSRAMLAGSDRFASGDSGGGGGGGGGGVQFQIADIADLTGGDGGWAAVPGGPGFDVIFANASLQWVNDHQSLLGALTTGLAAGGQLAFQVPSNYDHPSHTVATEVAAMPGFRAALDSRGGVDTTGSVLEPEDYAIILDGLGYVEQHVRLQVYGHHLAETADVVEWVKGTLLTPYRERLDAAEFEDLVAAYRRRLLERLGDQRPYFYPFKRILCWARLPRLPRLP